MSDFVAFTMDIIHKDAAAQMRLFMIKNEKLLPSFFAEGCLHLHVKDGEIQNAFSHLPLPNGEYVLHLKVDGGLVRQSLLNATPMTLTSSK